MNHEIAAATQSALNRRSFLTGISLAAAGTTGLLAGCGSNVAAATTQDTDMLNFALNLEYLEATLYSYLVNGTDILASSTGSSNNTPTGTIAGAPAKLTGLPAQLADLLAEIAFDEISHVNTLRVVLGAAAVARPNLNLAALGTITTANYLSLVRLIEDVGVTAYTGTTSGFTAAENIQAAAQILAVEAFHSGALRLLAIQNNAAYPTAGIPTDGYDIIPLDPSTNAINGPTSAGAFFATAGTPGNANSTASQTNTYPGFAYRRTTSQILAILYANTATGTASGGFFPNGLNGNIKTV